MERPGNCCCNYTKTIMRRDTPREEANGTLRKVKDAIEPFIIPPYIYTFE